MMIFFSDKLFLVELMIFLKTFSKTNGMKFRLKDNCLNLFLIGNSAHLTISEIGIIGIECFKIKKCQKNSFKKSKRDKVSLRKKNMKRKMVNKTMFHKQLEREFITEKLRKKF